MKARIKPFDIYIFLITLFKGLGAESNNVGYIGAFLFGCFVIFGKISREHYSKKEMISMLIILLIGVLDLIVGNTTTILFTAIAICGIKNVDFDHVVKIVLWTRIVTFLILIFGSTVGLINNEVLPFWRDGSFINRYSFGYDHPNMAQAALTIIIILILYLYGSQFRIWSYAILIAMDYLFYRFTFSRTGLIIGIICIVLDFITKNEKIRNVIMKSIRYSYWIFLIITFAVGILYTKIPVLTKVDVLFSGRIQYISILLKSNFPLLIGTTKYNAIVNFDNGYITLLYQGGILAFLWFTYYITKTYKNAYIKGLYKQYFLIFDFLLYAMTESFFMSIAVNISLIFIGNVLFKNKKYESRRVEG